MPHRVGRRKAAIGTFTSSTATTLLVSVQALVLMPLYLLHIGPRLYGAWLATGELLVLMLAFDMGIPNLMIQRIGAALASGDKRSIGAYFGTGAAVLGAFTLVLGLALALLAPFVPGWVGIQGAEAALLSRAFLLNSAAICLMLLNYLFQGLARGLQDTGMVNFGAFLGVVVGFAATLVLILTGWGLWSLAIGVAIRSLVALLASLCFLAFKVDREIVRAIRIDRSVGREFWKLSPPMFAAGVSYSLMNNGQVLLAAVMIGPEAAAIYSLTRKAADLARNILDAVGHASYGGFAHLFAAGDRARTRAVHHEIIAVYLAIGLALMSAYAAVNGSLVGTWVGPAMYGGDALTILFAVSTLVGGWSSLTLWLYRSTDHHKAVSNAMLFECGTRLGLMVVLVLLIGLPGLPLGRILTTSVSGMWARRKLEHLLSGESKSSPLHVWTVRLAMFAVGILICLASATPNWAFVFGVGGTLLVATLGLLLFADPLLSRMRAVLASKLARAAG